MLRFKLSPELVDGDHWTVVDTHQEVLEAVRAWLENDPVETEGFLVSVVEMSDEEVKALPEI